MDLTLNEKSIRMSGLVNIPVDSKLILGDNIKIMISGSIINVKDKDNQDGTYDRVFVIKASDIEIQQK